MQKYAFITSTGTNIGKTFLTTMLIKRAIKLNHRVNALKPIISGFNINDLNDLREIQISDKHWITELDLYIFSLYIFFGVENDDTYDY